MGLGVTLPAVAPSPRPPTCCVPSGSCERASQASAAPRGLGTGAAEHTAHPGSRLAQPRTAPSRRCAPPGRCAALRPRGGQEPGPSYTVRSPARSSEAHPHSPPQTQALAPLPFPLVRCLGELGRDSSKQKDGGGPSGLSPPGKNPGEMHCLPPFLVHLLHPHAHPLRAAS